MVSLTKIDAAPRVIQRLIDVGFTFQEIDRMLFFRWYISRPEWER